MEAYVAGDPRAFQILFERLAPPLHGFFQRAVGAAAADDLLQATFMKVHGARGRGRRGERVRPWVFAIAGNVRVDWARRHGRAAEEELREEELEAADDPGDPGADLLSRERGDRVRDALQKLTEPQRVVVELHRFEGLAFAEIGKALGISEGAAKLRAFRAYERLRGLLADLVSEEGS